MENRYFIDISYKGTEYHGWQRQIGIKSIQQTIEEALEILLQRKINIYGSSRTDTGVHAKQQIAHMDLHENLELDLSKIKYKLNCILPKNISINAIYKVKNGSHARFDAVERTYKYFICKNKDPFNDDFSVLYSKELDINKLNMAAQILLKKNNFESFSKTKSNVNNFICAIKKAFWEEKGDVIVFNITSNRFLRGMVRAIVGTSLKVGTGLITLNQFEEIIDSQDRKNAFENVDSKGLLLYSVVY